MAGFNNRFALNPKCLFISGVIGAGYWYLPPRDVFVLGGILVATYIGVAWYDELYDVSPEKRLKPGALSFLTRYFKP